MSTLLPILLGLQNGTVEIGDVGSIKDPLGQISRDLSPPLPRESSLEFSQIFDQKKAVDAKFNKLELDIPTSLSSDERPSVGRENNQSATSILLQTDPLDRFFSGLPNQIEARKTDLEVAGIPDLEETFDPISASPRNIFSVSDSLGNEHNLNESRVQLTQQPHFSAIPSAPIPPSLVEIASITGTLQAKGVTQLLNTDQTLEGQRPQAIENAVLLGTAQVLTPQGFQANANLQQSPLTERPHSNVPSQTGIQGLLEKSPLVGLNRDGGRIPQYEPLAKVSTAPENSPTKPQELFEKTTEVRLKRDPVLIARSDTPLKDFPGGTGQVVRPNIQEEVQKTPSIQRLNPSVLSSTSNVPSILAREGIVHQPDGIVGFTDRALVNPISTKPATGTPGQFHDVSPSLSELKASIPLPPHGESGLLEKWDRPQQAGDTLLKAVGLEANGGQGLGMGMNYSSNSNSGFQQNHLANAQGIGLRGSEGPREDLPAPALQRLQMDVQLSENHRVQLDVGVQNRHVSAGLVTDYSVLRNLATQFVPQLEAQLSNVDLELEEFSAELREEQEQQADAMFPEHRDQRHIGIHKQSHDDRPSTGNSDHRYDEQGLHLVA